MLGLTRFSSLVAVVYRSKSWNHKGHEDTRRDYRGPPSCTFVSLVVDGFDLLAERPSRDARKVLKFGNVNGPQKQGCHCPLDLTEKPAPYRKLRRNSHV